MTRFKGINYATLLRVEAHMEKHNGATLDQHGNLIQFQAGYTVSVRELTNLTQSGFEEIWDKKTYVALWRDSSRRRNVHQVVYAESYLEASEIAVKSGIREIYDWKNRCKVKIEDSEKTITVNESADEFIKNFNSKETRDSIKSDKGLKKVMKALAKT